MNSEVAQYCTVLQGLSWASIGDELGRYYRDCWDHYFMLKENKARRLSDLSDLSGL